MVRIAIVEDDAHFREELLGLLNRYEQEHQIRFAVDQYGDGLDIVESSTGQYDIILCDIQMKHMDGMRASKIIRQKDKHVIIIFLTNLAEYAIQGYEVAASGFLVKPVNYTMLSRLLDRVIEITKEKQEASLVIEEPTGIHRIRVRDIYYISHEKHYVHIFTKSGEQVFRMSVQDLEQKLQQTNIVKCNRGTLVNLEHVRTIFESDVVVADTRIPISRAKKKEFKEQLGSYLRGVSL